MATRCAKCIVKYLEQHTLDLYLAARIRKYDEWVLLEGIKIYQFKFIITLLLLGSLLIKLIFSTKEDQQPHAT
jgi:hypothetical protein